MKKILTIATIAIFASNIASASTGNNGNVNFKMQVKTTKHVKATKLNSFSIKGMQDTKDSLMPLAPQGNVVDYLTTSAS